MSGNHGKKTVLLGVTGSIAAYKAADIARQLAKKGRSVITIMTRSAREFITPLTFQTLTGNNVYTEVFEKFTSSVEHVSLSRQADLCLIAPATANIIAKLAHGIADDMLSTTALALGDTPVVVCPAMNTAMYDAPAMQYNIALLRERGVRLVEPKTAMLACGDTGRGALADVDAIVAEAERILCG